MNSSALFLFISLLFIGIVFNRASAWKEGYALQWDKAGYYVYLPAVFIYQDISHLSFYRDITNKYGLVIITGEFYRSTFFKLEHDGRSWPSRTAGE